MQSPLEIALNEAIQDEYKACATYRLVIRKFGPVRPFINILGSEQRHIQALRSLFRKYQLPIPIDHWETQLTAPHSLQEACRQGVAGEITNRAMYQRLLRLTTAYPDVQRVFRNLQRASQENHLRAFQRCAGLPVYPESSGHHPVSPPTRCGHHRQRRGCCARAGRVHSL